MSATNWEEALKTFLEKWKNLDYVEGAIVTGSHVVGTTTPSSDVDVHIILSSGIDWRERGNELIGGTLIEYFANPTFFFKQYLNEDYANNSRQNARMFTVGRMLFDKNGEVRKLVEQADAYMKRDFARPDEIWAEVAKYSIWDEFDGLEDSYTTKQPSFEYSCHLFLQNLLMKYTKFIGAEVTAYSKLYKYFSSDEFRSRYKIELFPDDEFATYFLQALRCKSEAEMYGLAKTLTSLVLDRMGGFNIDDWKLRTPATGKVAD